MRIALLLVGLIGFAAPPALAGAMGHEPVPVDLGRVDGLREIVLQDGAAVVQGAAGDYRIVVLPGGDLALAPSPAVAPAAVPAGMIPHAAVVSGERDVRAAWLAGPTSRYAHGVLGDAVEASILKVETRSGEFLSLELPADSVFEDLIPRLTDLDGDGGDEVILVKSRLAEGAAVAVYGIRGGALVEIAESPAIGHSNRWLNPVGAGDFDGDGRKEIAVVRTPHIGGILILYRMEGGKLVEVARRSGYSTHAMGSTVLGMSAVLDLDGDGADDILLPDQARSELFGLGFAGGNFRTVWNARNPARIVTSVVVSDVDANGKSDVLYGLADGSVRLLRR